MRAAGRRRWRSWEKGMEPLLGFYDTPLPVVIACTGHALAGGALLALTGDLRLGIAGPFKIGLNEVAIGLPVPEPRHGCPTGLPVEARREAPMARGAIYAPDDAVAAGYLDWSSSRSTLLARAREEAARLGALSPGAYAATKQLLRRPTIDRFRAGLGAELGRRTSSPWSSPLWSRTVGTRRRFQRSSARWTRSSRLGRDLAAAVQVTPELW